MNIPSKNEQRNTNRDMLNTVRNFVTFVDTKLTQVEEMQSKRKNETTDKTPNKKVIKKNQNKNQRAI